MRLQHLSPAFLPVPRLAFPLLAVPLALGGLAGSDAAQSNPIVSQGKFLTPDTALAKTTHRVAVSDGRALVSYLDADDVFNDKGAVYALERQPSGAWTQTGKLLFTLPEIGTGSGYGTSLDMAGDLAIVGDPSGASGNGVLRIWRHSALGWNKEAVLGPTWPWPGSGLGYGCAISGSSAIAGAPNATWDGTPSGGAQGYVSFYGWNGAAWTATSSQIFASDHSMGGRFGNFVAMDGARAAASSHTKDKVYVFENSGSGWHEVQKLQPTPAPALNIYYGSALSMSGDWLAVGAYKDSSVFTENGAVWMYERDALGQWVERQKLLASDVGNGDRFGIAVALRGARLVVGASFEDNLKTDAGSVYVFERDATGTWVERAKLTDPAAATFDALGSNVALDQDGSILATSPEDDDVASDLGTVFLWDADSLSADKASISLAAGGTQSLDLQAGTSNAGRFYLLAGSVSGNTPGTPLPGGLLLPLNYDAYTSYTLATPNQPPLAGSMGLLGANGGGHASFSLPAGSSPTLASVVASHAFVAVDLGGGGIAMASNAVGVQLAP